MKKWLVPVLAVFAALALAADWPHTRGPGQDGRVTADGTFGETIGLEPAWQVQLGSGYSGVVVADGRVVTLFGGGDSDWVAAFDAATGKPLWKQSIGAIHRGHDGSDDGPLSSPLIGAGRVFALAPDGRLHAFRLEDGSPLWSRMLVQDLGARAPFFGFTTVPLLEGGVLVLQAGGTDGRSIVGLDPASGKTLWSRGDDGVEYQSPVVLELAGQRQIVAVGTKTITGLTPDGRVLWTHALAETDRVSQSQPSFAGADRFLVAMSEGVTVYRVSRGSEGFEVAESYRSEALGQSYAPPVYHDGHLYGFRGQVLSCMNAESGERVWRSRPPGGDGLILVDDHLVIFGSKGQVVVADASPAGYVERARIAALTGSGLTWPSFADGRIFVRNLEQLAAVKITRGADAAVAGATNGDHEFGRWLERLEAAEDRATMIDEFFRRHERWPLVEGPYVHFVYRGTAQDVAIAGSMLDTDNPEPLRRVPGTDLFHRTYRLEPGGRWEYRLMLDFEQPVTDPRNPRTVPPVEGSDALSELVADGYALADHTGEPEGPRGRLERFTLASELLGYDKEIRVWLPPGYDEGERAYPVLLVDDGAAWLDKASMANSLDNLVGRKVAPLIVAFLAAPEQWWLEAGGSRTEDFVRMQVEELLPQLRKRYRLAAGPGSCAVMGHRFYGASVAFAALGHPEVFGKAAIQSVYLGLGTGDEIAAMIRSGKAAKVQLYLDWNRYDERNIDRGWDMAQDSRQLAAWLKDAGHTFMGGEVLDSNGWGGWRNRTDRILIALFPAP